MTVAISLAHYLYYFNAIASSLSAGGHNVNTRVEVLKPTPVLLEVDLPQCFYTSTTTSAFTPLPLPTPTSTRPRVFLPELDEEINTTPVFSFTPTTFFGLSFSTSAKLETCSSLVLEREINGNQKWDDAFAISTLVVVLLAFVVLILQAPSTEADTSNSELEQEELSNVDSIIWYQAALDAISDSESTSKLSLSSSAITYAFETSSASDSGYEVDDDEFILNTAATNTISANLEPVEKCEIASLELPSLVSLAQAAMFTVTLLELELGQPSDNSLIDFESDFSVELNCSNPESLSLETTSMEGLVFPALGTSIVIVASPSTRASCATSTASLSQIEPPPTLSIEAQISAVSPSLESSSSDTILPILTTSEATADDLLTSASTSTTPESLLDLEVFTVVTSSRSQRQTSPSAKPTLANAAKTGSKRSRKLQKKST